MKLYRLATALLGAVIVPTSAFAQAAAEPTATPAAVGTNLAVGAMVYDPQGGEVGEIESVSANSVVINTGNSSATLPRGAFGSGPKGLTIQATKAQVDAAVAQVKAKETAALGAALVPGAHVRGKSGAAVGTIKEVNGDQVILDRPGGAVTLTKAFFAVGANGLSLTMTATELEAAAKAASAGASTTKPATSDR